MAGETSIISTIRVTLAGAALALALAPGPGLAQVEPRRPASVAELAAQLSPTVVNIATTRRLRFGRSATPQAPDGSPLQDYFDGLDEPREFGEREVSSLGSGFVISPEGLIATNNHVVAEADEIVVIFPDGTALEAELVGADDKTDLAVLRVQPDTPLPAAALGDSESAQVGDWVMAIGNPFGLGGSVSLGIVSALNRDIDAGPYDSFIQTDAAINQGNSGGPLFDMNGEVVGINTAIIANGGRSMGVGFAVPVNLARPVLEQLATYGETRRGWLGVSIQDVTEDIAASLGLDSTHGAMVLSVTPDGPSDGLLREGDIILDLDGVPIVRMRELPLLVAESGDGRAVTLRVLRNGEPIGIDVTLGRLEQGELRLADLRSEAPEELPPRSDLLGLDISPMTDALRQTYAISSDLDRVVITGVDPGSDAYDKGIRPGQMIVEINQRPVTSPAQVADIIGTAIDGGREAVLLMLADAADNRRFIAVRVDR